MLVIAYGSSARGATITVDDSGGADYTSIGEALAAAASGDTVLVADGTYTGSNNRQMDFNGKNIVLLSEHGAASTIIDCQQGERAFTISPGVDSTAVIQGFTIANALYYANGGGIYIQESNPKILDCVITNNSGSWNGAGLFLSQTPPVVVSGCTFSFNSAGYRGGAIMTANGSSAVMRDCLFFANSTTTTDQSYYYGGGALYVQGSDSPGTTVRRCTFAGNTSMNGTGAGAIQGSEGTLVVENCILAFGAGGSPAMGWDTLVSHSVVFGNTTTDTLSCDHHDNLFLDPLFCGMASHDYTLCSNSPCLPGSPQNPWGELVGALESGCGECGSAVEPTSWGRIKGLYR